MEPSTGSITAAIETLGDRWTLLILRDVIFEDRRYFRALLTGSAEGIASNILADRLVRLVDAGILARGTAARGQRARYSLTEAGIQTLPILLALGVWGAAWRREHDELTGRPSLTPDVAQLIDELRARHRLDPSPG
ncbi:hypothetical protein BH11ACT3_BH11ACT3_19900 [soil metagenome]